MADEKKKPEEETDEVKPPEEQIEPPKPEEKPTGKAQSEENGEQVSNKKQSEKASREPMLPELSEEDRLREENFRLTTQLEAMKIGFVPEVVEDAVVLAENIVRRDGSDIATALQAVAKKYPDWKANGKSDKSMGGFKVGIDTSNQADFGTDKIRQAFGIKNK